MKTFIWEGKEIGTKEDFGRAFLEITTQEQADAFKELFAKAFPEWTDQILGYLTAEAPEPHSVRVRNLFGVVHPLNPYDEKRTPQEAFKIGYEIGKNPPPWMLIAIMIPRESMDISYNALKVKAKPGTP